MGGGKHLTCSCPKDVLLPPANAMASSRDVESRRAVVLKESPEQQQAIGSREVGYRGSCQQPALCPRRSQKCGPSSGEARWDENGDGTIPGRTKGTTARCGNLGGTYVPPSSSRSRASLCGSTTPTSVFARLINLRRLVCSPRPRSKAPV